MLNFIIELDNVDEIVTSIEMTSEVSFGEGILLDIRCRVGEARLTRESSLMDRRGPKRASNA